MNELWNEKVTILLKNAYEFSRLQHEIKEWQEKEKLNKIWREHDRIDEISYKIIDKYIENSEKYEEELYRKGPPIAMNMSK